MLRLFLLGDDVDVPAGELRGEPHVLAAPADRERELLVGHHDLHALAFLVEHDLGDFGGRERVDHEVGRVRGPRNDVDLLALQLVDDRLHARAAHADAGADRIDRGVARDHRDLGARSGIAGDRPDLDDAVVDFRHFLREQLGHELRMRARQEDLRPARLAPHVVDEGADAVAVAEGLARQHLVAAHDRLAAAEIDHDVAVLDPLDDAVDDVADAILVFLILPVALGLAHLLHDHLLGGLRRDATVFERRQRFRDVVADLRGRIALLGVVDRDLGRVVLDLIDDQHQAREPHLAGLRIDLGADFGLAAVARARRLLDRVLHGGDHDAAVDRLLASDRIGDLQQFEPVGADGHRSVSFVLGRAAIAVGPKLLRARLVGAVAAGVAPGGARLLVRALGLAPARLLVVAGLAHWLLPRLSDSLMTASVSVTFASAMSPIGNRTSASSPDAASSRRSRALSPSVPMSEPRKRRRPSTAIAISTLMVLPVLRSKSERRTSGRSMPGDEISSR